MRMRMQRGPSLPVFASACCWGDASTVAPLSYIVTVTGYNLGRAQGRQFLAKTPTCRRQKQSVCGTYDKRMRGVRTSCTICWQAGLPPRSSAPYIARHSPIVVPFHVLRR